MADITVTALDVRPLPGAIIIRMKAGSGGVNVGQAVYISAADTVLASDADLEVSANVFGIVVAAPGGALAVVAGDWCDVAVFGPVTGFSGMTAGDKLHNSTTAGALSDTQAGTADFIGVAGWAVNAVVAFLNPYMTNPYVVVP